MLMPRVRCLNTERLCNMCQQPFAITRNDSTFTRKGKKTQNVPCGKCAQCVKSKLKTWTFRIEQHLRVTSNPIFLTLTYNDENLPYYVDSDTGEISNIPTLQKSDCQKFFKRLRFNYEKHCKQTGFQVKKLSYYLVGEYGTRFGRPHYHALVFNLDFPELIDRSWGLGFSYSLPLLTGGIRYVLKYMAKAGNKSRKPAQNEFSLPSKGIGRNYLTPNVKLMHQRDLSRNYVTSDTVGKISLPKYYKDLLFSPDERYIVSTLAQLRADGMEEKSLADFLRKFPNETVESAIRSIALSKLSEKIRPRLNEVF